MVRQMYELRNIQVSYPQPAEEGRTYLIVFRRLITQNILHVDNRGSSLSLDDMDMYMATSMASIDRPKTRGRLTPAHFVSRKIQILPAIRVHIVQKQSTHAICVSEDGTWMCWNPVSVVRLFSMELDANDPTQSNQKQ